MDFSFHIQQGQKLLEKKDAISVKKALEHFIKANEMTDEEDIGKPKILYLLAFGNLIIGQIEQSYRLAFKAKRSIDVAIENSIFSMNNMRQMLGENDIDTLIHHIEEKYAQVVYQIDTEDDNFDENVLDFSHLSQMYPSVVTKDIEPKFSINETELAKMRFTEHSALSKKCAENGDLESLLTISKYRFIHGSAGTNEFDFPIMCYYYGRLRRIEELKELLNEKQFHLFLLPDSCKELAQNLLNIGLKFPHLNEQEISYLEQKYCDSKTYQVLDAIMFDSDKLSRPIKKFDTNLLRTKNTEFSRDLLLDVFSHFSANEDLDDGYSELYVYSRIKNNIIRKKHEHVGLGEYCIFDPILSNEFYNILKRKYGIECADYFAEILSPDNLESFKTDDYYILDAKRIEDMANDYFQNPSKVEDLKIEIAQLWLNKINSREIKL